jgi:hypothetical protein
MGKTKIVCCLLAFGVFFWLLPLTGEAAPVAVNCAGESLQTAINSGTAGTAFSVTGTCNEFISILETRERVTIDGGGTATIHGPDTTNNTVTVRGQGVTITGFTISGGSDGISVQRGGVATIDDNTIQNTGANGISVSRNGFAIIINNTIGNNPFNGISVGEGSSARIGFSSSGDTVASPNIIENNAGDGIGVNRSSDARIVGNTIRNNTGHGVAVTKVSYADISNNVIDGNTLSGIYVSGNSGVNLGNPSGSTIYDLPNDTTDNNDLWGVNCESGSYVSGRLGTLNGTLGNNKSGNGFSSIFPANDFSIVAPDTGTIRLGVGTPRMTIASNGNIGIGTPTPTSPLHINSATGGTVLQLSTTSPTGGGGFNFAVPTGGNWNFKATQDNGFKIKDAANSKDVFYVQYATGNVGIGTITPAHTLQVCGPGGCSYNDGGTAWINASSREYKDNIQTLSADVAINALNNLNPVTFTYKTMPEQKHVGFVAEEVPDIVAMRDRKGLSAMDIVAVLTKVVQELKTENEGLKTKNESLENRLLVIEATIKALK